MVAAPRVIVGAELFRVSLAEQLFEVCEHINVFCLCEQLIVHAAGMAMMIFGLTAVGIDTQIAVDQCIVVSRRIVGEVDDFAARQVLSEHCIELRSLFRVALFGLQHNLLSAEAYLIVLDPIICLILVSVFATLHLDCSKRRLPRLCCCTMLIGVTSLPFLELLLLVRLDLRLPG